MSEEKILDKKISREELMKQGWESTAFFFAYGWEMFRKGQKLIGWNPKTQIVEHEGKITKRK